MIELSALRMAEAIRRREISSIELVSRHLDQIRRVNPAINAVADLLDKSALDAAAKADARLAAGNASGRLHGVPFSIKDSIDVQGTKCTAGTFGRKDALPAEKDATLVARLREAGAIPIAKTNLPDLLFSFETDNLIYGRTSNPYNLACSSGGSSGGEAALLSVCGSPLGLGSDALGSVRLPAAFCGVTAIKPTSGRLPRTGHVPPAGGWIEAVWQIGPMARWVEDLELAMELLACSDAEDFTSLPVPLFEAGKLSSLRVAFYTYNGFAPCSLPVKNAVEQCAKHLSGLGIAVEEVRPPGVESVYDLELGLLGAEGGEDIDDYLRMLGSTRVHPHLSAFVDRLKPYKSTMSQFSRRWAQWLEYRSQITRFFRTYDAVLCPVYTEPAVEHGSTISESKFRGFSYTMAWNIAGAPAATLRVAEHEGLPINVQIAAAPWQDMTALRICRLLEAEFGGWQPPRLARMPK